MGFTFIGLLFMQITYLQTMRSTREEQFDEAVKRSLYQVSRILEQDDTRRYLEEEMAEADKSIFSVAESQDQSVIHQILTKQGRTTRNPDGSIATFDYQEFSIQSKPQKQLSISDQHGRNAIPRTIEDAQRELRDRYVYQKEIFDYVVLDMLQTASRKSINERIDYKKLNEYIRAELLNNGVNMPFQFAIVNRDGIELFKGNGYENSEITENSYMYPIFSKDPPARIHYLKIYFPTKTDYIRSSVKFIVPSFIFTFVLLLTFSITIIMTFREKRLTEMRNDFINNMTHEFKTPISTISLAAQMLKDPVVGKSPSMFQHISRVINDETKRLSFQVEKVLQMSMFERQRTSLKMVEADINDLVNNVTSTFKLKVEQFGGTIITVLDAKNHTAMIDEMHFTNVVFNLLDNAVKYRKADVDLQLEVKTWNENERLIISIQDNGIGIRKENLKKIFDKFFRVHTGNIHNVKGFGLGLAYVKRIVDEHKASIRAESEINIGTKFIISLPTINNV